MDADLAPGACLRDTGQTCYISTRLLAIGADSPDGIWLKVRDSTVPGGARVEWGDSAHTPRKARVLTALLLQHGIVYDVRSPDTPAVTPAESKK